MKIHDSITPERVIEAIEESHAMCTNPGFCVECGEDADGVEPDACKYKCSVCGAETVYGAEELLFYVG